MIKILYAFLILGLQISSTAGDVNILGPSEKVPDWAIGPLLVTPMERIVAGHLKADKSDCVRIGTIQSKSVTIFGRRYTLESIELSEIPNDAKICVLKTMKTDEGYYEVHLSQSLFDQTFYNVLIEWIDHTGKRSEGNEQFAVWDTKSRK
jgi:hypothetical protein